MTVLDTTMTKRDYSLTGPERQRAIDAGMVSAQWYHSEVPRKVVKELMRRRNGPAMRDSALWMGLQILMCNALGMMSDQERDYIPETELPKAVFWARVHIAIYVVALGLALALQSLIPLMLIGGPRIYGAWHMVMLGLLQHGGVAEDTLDHRLNSRTVCINPISRWLYWNMNYHVEHHMFPMVPYHALPKLHALIKDDLPAPNRSIANAYVEMVGALLRQQQEPGYFVRRALPPTARPYREDLHDVEVARA